MNDYLQNLEIHIVNYVKNNLDCKKLTQVLCMQIVSEGRSYLIEIFRFIINIYNLVYKYLLNYNTHQGHSHSNKLNENKFQLCKIKL